MSEKMEKKRIKWKRRIEKKQRNQTINSCKGVGQEKKKIIIKIFPEKVVIINSQ